MKVYKVEIDPAGVKDLMRSEEVAAELKRICDERAEQINAKARMYLHGPLGAPLFTTKVIKEPGCYMGIIHGIGIRTRDGQVKPIAQQIDRKHHVMTW